MKPALKPSIEVEYQGGQFRFYVPLQDQSITYQSRVGMERVLAHLDGSKAVDEIAALCPDLGGDVRQIVSDLGGLGLLYDAATEPTFPGSWERYQSQLTFFQEYGADPATCQAQVEKVTVGILGAGTGGSQIAVSLAAAGVGRIMVIDPDVVAWSNLNRQTYHPRQVGKPKVFALAEQIGDLNPDVEVVSIQERIDNATTLARHMQGCSLIINAADEPDSRFTSRLVSETGMVLGVPHMVGGGYRLNRCYLSVTVIPGVTPCFTCMRLSLGLVGPWTVLRRSPSAGTLGPISLMTANLHALEALRILSGFEPPALAGRWVHLDLTTLEKREEPFGRHPLCPHCNQ